MGKLARLGSTLRRIRRGERVYAALRKERKLGRAEVISELQEIPRNNKNQKRSSHLKAKTRKQSIDKRYPGHKEDNRENKDHPREYHDNQPFCISQHRNLAAVKIYKHKSADCYQRQCSYKGRQQSL